MHCNQELTRRHEPSLPRHHLFWVYRESLPQAPPGPYLNLAGILVVERA